jgi:hypothetical protein
VPKFHRPGPFYPANGSLKVKITPVLAAAIILAGICKKKPPLAKGGWARYFFSYSGHDFRLNGIVSFLPLSTGKFKHNLRRFSRRRLTVYRASPI